MTDIKTDLCVHTRDRNIDRTVFRRDIDRVIYGAAQQNAV